MSSPPIDLFSSLFIFAFRHFLYLPPLALVIIDVSGDSSLQGIIFNVFSARRYAIVLNCPFFIETFQLLFHRSFDSKFHLIGRSNCPSSVILNSHGLSVRMDALIVKWVFGPLLSNNCLIVHVRTAPAILKLG